MDLTNPDNWRAEHDTHDEESDWYDTPSADDTNPALDDDIEPQYTDVVGWVEGWFLPIIRRKVTDTAGSGQSWDARWWAYPEVVARLIALHYAWEEARASDQMSAMSSWWIHHLEPHLRIILDGENGPMANADRTGSWMGWPALAGEPVPVDVLNVIAPTFE